MKNRQPVTVRGKLSPGSGLKITAAQAEINRVISILERHKRIEKMLGFRRKGAKP
jgi:hypothetical protein